MQYIADLHIHGRHSQATSKALDIPNLEKYGKIKGINLLGTGDFTHPKWIEHIKENLTEDGSGFLQTKTGMDFILTTEISLIYSQGGKGRRVHNLVFAPDLDAVKQITDWLLTKGRIDYDGRPIFKIPCPEFVESLRDISEDIEVVPAHIWTPWFSMFGSKSGFDSVKECFGDQTKYIHAYETGLSSDPEMNWRVSQLDKYNQVSFSDLHSFWPWRMGREATMFDINRSYKDFLKALRTGSGLTQTIEVDPNYGKYHVDGHRKCNVIFDPEESKKHNGICPVCKKELTIGVLNRVEEMADRPEGFKPEGAKPFLRLLPLADIISLISGKAVATKGVWKTYQEVTALGESEFDVMINVPEEDILKNIEPRLAQAIIDNRNMKIKIKPGYDGVYGVPLIGDIKEEPTKTETQEPEIKSDAQFGPVKEFKTPKQKGLNDFF